MLRLIHVIFQMDEASKYIRQGRLETYRLALILLDNAAELQIDRKIRDLLDHDEFYEKIKNRIIQESEARPRRLEHIPESLKEILEKNFLSRKEKQKINKYFDEKVNYLLQNKLIDQGLACSLKSIHKYRNSAYHYARIRPETIGTEAMIIFDINCQLLNKLPLPGLTYSFDENEDWLYSKMGLDKTEHPLINNEAVGRVVDELRKETLPPDEAITSILARNLSNRFSDIFDALKFISENALGITDLNEALEHCLFWKAVDEGKVRSPSLDNDTKRSFSCEYDMDRLVKVSQTIEQVTSATNQIDAFVQYSVIEGKIEPLEKCIFKMVDEIESFIQLEVDRIRGK